MNMLSLDKNMLVNIINNYRQALNFYSDSSNYVPNPNNSNIKYIDLDSGHQARFVIETMDKLFEQYSDNNNTQQDSFDDIEQNIKKDIENLGLNDHKDSSEVFNNLIQTINKLKSKI